MTPRFALRLAALVALLVAPAGCTLYADDDDGPCLGIERLGFRNPENGVCMGLGGGGCGGDDGPRPLGAPEPLAAPDMAACPGPCEGQGENQCLADPACRAVYLECPPNADCAAQWNFHECWGIAPSGPAEDREACESLDAYACSRRNDCVAHYRWAGSFTTPAIVLEFAGCAAEPAFQGCYADADCPPDHECTSDTECLPPPGCDPDDGACPPVCYGRCVPLRRGCEVIDCAPGAHCEERCYACDPAPGMECPTEPWCEATCVPDQTQTCAAVTCPAGTHCEERCAGNVCTVTCVPNGDPGACYGPVACASLPPACPTGTVAGRRNGCWTGYCIPTWACEPPPPPLPTPTH
ncbi:MAG TPA: hypothetical protein VM734_18275 [Kofleriaceae bacterium]|jgi:hypothetical protein|nr:hypothetical protein [Kofleriaceae bacterium]